MLRHYLIKVVYALTSMLFLVSCADTNFAGQQASQAKPKKADGKLFDADPASDEESIENDADLEMVSPKPQMRESIPDSASGRDPATNEIDVAKSSPKRVEQIIKNEGEKIQSAVDIVFAMDTSSSMSDEKATLERNMANFVKNFEEQSKTIDYRIYMIGAGFNFPGSGEKITKVNHPIDSVNALSILTNFFLGKIPNPVPLRPMSSKQLIVISDDDAKFVTAPQFKKLIANTNILKDKTSFSAIVGVKAGGGRGGCSVANVGTAYIELAGDPQVGGLLMNICEQDWDKLLKSLATKIIKEVAKTEFRLEMPASLKDEILVFVDGKPVEAKNFTYDAASQMIKFVAGFMVAIGAEIKVSYVPQAEAR